MAKELGLNPRSLTKNIPAKSQPWKAPVRQWVRDLHAKRFGKPAHPARPAPPPPAARVDVSSWLDLDLPVELSLEDVLGLPPARPAPIGTDAALVVPACGRDEPLTVTYWDFWFSLVAAADHGGDLARLADALADDEHPRCDGESVRRKRSYIRDWSRRLSAAGRTIDDILAAAGGWASSELSRARRRVLEPTEKPND